MSYWLMKSEPDVFGIDHLQRLQVSPWDGVRNYQARNNLQAMHLGDRFFFYHSSCDPSGVVGEGEIVRIAYPDQTACEASSPYFDAKSTPEQPRWFMVDVRFRERYPRLVSLQELRSIPQLAHMVLLNNSRLSVQPVSAAEFKLIRALAHAPARADAEAAAGARPVRTARVAQPAQAVQPKSPKLARRPTRKPGTRRA